MLAIPSSPGGVCILGTVLLMGMMAATRANGAGPERVTVRYEPTDAIFPNPERGFYHQRTARVRGDDATGGYTPLEAAELASIRDEESTTLLLRMYYLDPFVDGPIADAYLTSMQADFDAVRVAGVKAIVRFAYRGGRDIEPYNATKAWILAHIDQLTPVLGAHIDVIAAAQAGFIGRWGEWWYASHEFTREGGGADYSHYAEVVAALLDALPDERFVQVRTPSYKQAVTGVATPLGADTAYGDSLGARVGHHNDCFLATDTDMGTYSGESDREYLALDTLYAPMGGETCRPYAPHSLCENALAEMARFHWSYINWDYHGEVLDSWRGECLDDVQRRLGYRLELVSTDMAAEVHATETTAIRVVLRNVGFAAPYNPRDVEIVLRDVASGEERTFAALVDPRMWLAGETHSVEWTLPPAAVPLGSYELYLNLPDPQPSLRANTAYSIRLANAGAWEAATGYNHLRSAFSVR